MKRHQLKSNQRTSWSFSAGSNLPSHQRNPEFHTQHVAAVVMSENLGENPRSIQAILKCLVGTGDPRALQKTHPNPSFLEGPMILRALDILLWNRWTFFGSYRYEEEKNRFGSKSVVDSHPPPQIKENIQQKWPGKHQIKKHLFHSFSDTEFEFPGEVATIFGLKYLLSGYLPFTNPQLGVNHPSRSPSTPRNGAPPKKKWPTYC